MSEREYKPPPAFQFYPADFMMGAAAMSKAERGDYITLLCYQWNHRSIPSDPGKQRRICGGPVSDAVIAKFPPDGQGELKNVRLELERQKQASWRKKCSDGGKKSGATRRARVVELPFEGGREVKGNSSVFSLQSSEEPPLPPGGSAGQNHAVEMPPGFPADEQAARRIAEVAGLPQDFAESVWVKASGRGGRDARDVPIRSFVHHLKVEWKYQQERVAKEKHHASNQPNGKPSVDRNAGTLNAGTSAQYGKLATMGKLSVPRGPAT